MKIVDKLLAFTSTNSGLFFICSILSVLFFIYYFGAAVINFGYTDWLMSDEIWVDVQSTYTTWRLFLNADWMFPFRIDNIAYPLETSVAFLNPPILWSLFFKFLSPLFPQNFQYLGFMCLVHYILMGGISGILLKKLTNNSIFSILGSLIFLLSPYMLQRVYYHGLLTAHFIIILCIYFCVPKRAPRKLHEIIIIWTGLVVFASVQHFYFVPMVLFFMFAYLIDDYCETKKVIRQSAVLLSSVVCTLLTMFACGFFYGEQDTIQLGLGFFSANLNTFINSMDTSAFLPQLKLATEGQYEGYSYLGLGVIAGIIFVICAAIRQIIIRRSIIKEKFLTKPSIIRRTILAAAVISAALIMALSPIVTLNQSVLFHIPIPKFIEDIWGAFRSTGRMAWIVSYIITVFTIQAIYKLYGKKFSLAIISAIVIFQFADLNDYFKSTGDPYKEKIEYKSKLSRPEWKILAEKYKYFFFMHENQHAPDYYMHFDIAYLAADNNCRINNHFLAREDADLLNSIKRYEWKNILENRADPEKLYLFLSPNKALNFFEEYLYENNLGYLNFHFYKIDNYIIGLKEKEDFLEKYLWRAFY